MPSKHLTIQPVSASIKMQVKPLSVNDAWKGQRFKTNEYKAYEKLLLCTLPNIQLPAPPYKVVYEFGLSNVLCDFDNPVKPLTDVLQKKYGFNDKQILEAIIRKVKVEKGTEYFTVQFETIYETV